MTEAHRLLHGGESQVWGDGVTSGVALDWQVAMKPGRRRQLAGSNAALTEKRKASIVHPFLKVKQLFGYAKVRYRGNWVTC